MLNVSHIKVLLGGHPVVRDVSFEIDKGEMIVLTGASGSGKTTILRALAGLVKEVTGEIEFNGIAANEAGKTILPPWNRPLSLMFQDLGLWPNLTIARNVRMGLAKSILSRVEKNTKVEEWLERLKIDHLRKRKPTSLSMGEQQRVALARALIGQPSILLLDEPFASLDLLLRHEFFELLSENLSSEMCCLVVTHDPFDAIGLNADRVLVLEDGKVVDDVSNLREGPFNSEILKKWQSCVLSGSSV